YRLECACLTRQAHWDNIGFQNRRILSHIFMYSVESTYGYIDTVKPLVGSIISNSVDKLGHRSLPILVAIFS
ncbi:MAG TPA: hypothetical protein VEH06_07015, partial [Candidatus Bathyarchaeia archaeon]|nr:hypothetical protein [Candidatus Bathyarchaeia archaeon]